MSDDHDPERVVFYVYGLEKGDLDHVYDHDYDGGYDHVAADAATVVFNELKKRSRFEWADKITGVAMAVGEADE